MLQLLTKFRTKNFMVAATTAVVMLLIFGIYTKVGATSYNITGVIKDATNNYVSGAYVYATNPGSDAILYGPVSTSIYGAYTLPLAATGTYDIHFTPPANKGYVPIVDSSVVVSGSQAINHTFTSQTNTLSGTLTDVDGNPLSGITIKLSNSNTYQTVTDANGNYSITAPATYYYLYLAGSLPGISSFTLSQQNATSINLLTSSQTLNLSIKTATMTVTPRSNNGQPSYGQAVSARATSGIASLYPGDPGTTITSAISTGFTSSGTSGTIKTIVGATYAASGLEAASFTTSICEMAVGYDCLRTPLTVNADTSLDLPSASPAVRTFSGVLTDSSGNPISNAQVTLIKGLDSTTYTTTDSNGNFSISVMPKKYYLKVAGLANSTVFTLTQSSTNPTVDLTSNDVTQNLQVKTATLTISAYTTAGNPSYMTTVNVQPSGGTTTLYSGDPGETIVIQTSGFATTGTSNVGTAGTIVGATYSGKGLGVSNPSGSICAANPAWNCLVTAYTVTGSASLNVPQ